nr:dsc e3 ubiquitin ligase complex subunit 3 [Quercus suber]
MAMDLVIRFSTSNPDVIIPIASPDLVSGLALKQLVRKHLVSPAAESRLRLIHAGKVLPDTGALSRSITVSRPPPVREDDDFRKSERSKGKRPVREAEPTPVRIYIHCSIGDALTPSELISEAKEAYGADEALQDNVLAPSRFPASANLDFSQADVNTTTPAPRGFDRLFTAGFTAAEVATLRSQFLAIQAHTHTPDTMPSGPDLLALEERWLDSGSNAATAGADDTGGFGAEDAGGLEDLLYGNVIG